MSTLAELLDRSERASAAVARSSQAAVLQVTDWAGQRWPAPARRLVRAWLGTLEAYVEEPAHTAARPYGMLNELVALHREFTQRLLELIEESEPIRTAPQPADFVVVPFPRARRAPAGR